MSLNSFFGNLWGTISFVLATTLSTLPTQAQINSDYYSYDRFSENTSSYSSQKIEISEKTTKNRYSCDLDLENTINSIVNHPDFRSARWGILISELNSGKTIYNLDADKYFIPASNVKLLTTASALLELGKNFTIKTPIYATGELPNLKTLRIRGKGDPTISKDMLIGIAGQLKDLGVKKIEELIVEDNYFSSPSLNPTWEWSDVYSYYATNVSSLILNLNSVTLTILPTKIGQPVNIQWSDEIADRQWIIKNRAITTFPNTEYNISLDGILGKPILNIRGELGVDSQPDIWDLAILDPATYFLESLEDSLINLGIKIDRKTVRQNTRDNRSERIVGTIFSPSLKDLIQEINQNSNNLYAEAILKILGKELNLDNAIEGIELSLAKLEIDPQNYILSDGSGLSRHNLITPETIVQLLIAMSKVDEANTYQESLAIAGVKGSLRKRFENIKDEIDFQGKTGTLSGVSALSGYLNLSETEPIVLSIILNNSRQSNKKNREAIDSIIVSLSKIQKCAKKTELL